MQIAHDTNRHLFRLRPWKLSQHMRILPVFRQSMQEASTGQPRGNHREEREVLQYCRAFYEHVHAFQRPIKYVDPFVIMLCDVKPMCDLAY